MPVPELVATFDIKCDNGVIDQVQNQDPYFLKCRDHYKNGVWTAWNYHYNNVTFVSTITHEVFKVQLTEQGSWEGMDYIDGNLIGDKGSHYIMKLVVNPMDWSLVDASFSCH